MTQKDLDIRLQLITIKISELGNKYANDLRIGSNCINTTKNELLLLEAYLKFLKCYKIYELNTCLTEKEMLKIFDTISKLFNICFPPVNRYKDYYRITTNNRIRSIIGGESRTYIH